MVETTNARSWRRRKSHIYGFHATDKANVDSILTERYVKPSEHWYDWLGYGSYFYQEAPLRALKWLTQEKHEGTVRASEAALVVAKIRVQKFIDLLSPQWVEVIRNTYARLHLETADKVAKLRQLQPPHRMGGMAGPHPLDKYIIDTAVGAAKKKRDDVKGVRSIFYDGDLIFDDSHLFDRQHIQIAVVDRSVVEDLWEDMDCQHYLSQLVSPLFLTPSL
jgi:hypothetical protein